MCWFDLCHMCWFDLCHMCWFDLCHMCWFDTEGLTSVIYVGLTCLGLTSVILVYLTGGLAHTGSHSDQALLLNMETLQLHTDPSLQPFGLGPVNVSSLTFTD